MASNISIWHASFEGSGRMVVVVVGLVVVLTEGLLVVSVTGGRSVVDPELVGLGGLGGLGPVCDPTKNIKNMSLKQNIKQNSRWDAFGDLSCIVKFYRACTSCKLKVLFKEFAS